VLLAGDSQKKRLTSAKQSCGQAQQSCGQEIQRNEICVLIIELYNA
jgi:hypothetical protein